MNRQHERQRLQKLIAGAGIASRRTVEDWIRAGRVTVNGAVARLGDRAGPTDEVRLDGELLNLSATAASGRLLIYNKPVGEVTTRSDPQGRPTVFARLPPPDGGRWISIGRLDIDTSGLLLFTTDGELAHRLMHPSSEIEREYRVQVRGRPTAETLRKLLDGVRLEDGPARFDRIVPEDAPASRGGTFRVVLHTGRKREVRRLWSAVGHEVLQLTRLRYGPAELPAELAPGRWIFASDELIGRVRAAAQLS